MSAAKLLAWVSMPVVIAFAGAPAHAVGKCKAKVDKQTGAIVVNASDVANNPFWGPAPDQLVHSFDDVVGCFTGGKLKNCKLGPPDSVLAFMPPESCVVHVGDDGAEDCAAPLKGCTPGLRPGVPTEALTIQANSQQEALSIYQAGTGNAAQISSAQAAGLRIDTAATNEDGALQVNHTGPEGSLASFDLQNPANPRAAIFARSNGLGFSGWFEVGTGGTGDAVFARSTSGGAGARAGVFVGPVDVTGNLAIDGNLTKSSGSFQIDHPLDPANRYLSHSFVESPDMMNVYNGNATLAADGRVVVLMPEWFEALNRDFRYQLTPLGAPAPELHVAKEIAGNRFEIAGGPAGLRVSWQVTGVRQDAWANAHRIDVETEKSLAERGSYLHPELFGQPESKRRGAAAPAPPDIAGGP